LWAFLGLSAVAVAPVKLGALSVWVTFLSATVKVLVLVAIVLVALVVWRLALQWQTIPGAVPAVAAHAPPRRSLQNWRR
jgi:uncharacterized membrane protein (UPF0182 family)